MQSVSDMIANRVASEVGVPTSNPTVAAGLPSSYYNGSVLRNASSTIGTATQRLADTANAATVNQFSVAALQQQRNAQLLAQQNLAAAKKAGASVDAQVKKAGTQSFNIHWSNSGPSAQQIQATGGIIGHGTSTRYQVQDTRGYGNTSGASQPGAIGGVRGSGTYKYVVNSKLDASRNKVLALATSYLGTPYVLGGTTHTSIDCSGLVMAVYSQLGYSIPMHSATWQKNNIPGVRVAFNQLSPGDLVCWKDGSHIAIYAGGGEIIEAANENRGTLARPLWDSPDNVIGIHLRLPGE